MTEPDLTLAVDRRTLLRRGALVGAAVWAVPVVQVVGMTAASAVDPSGGGGGGGGGDGETPGEEIVDKVVGKVPSHALCLVTYLGGLFGLKLDGTTFGRIASPDDISYLMDVKGFATLVPKTLAGGGLRVLDPVKDVVKDPKKDDPKGPKQPEEPVLVRVPSWQDPSPALLAVMAGNGGPGTGPDGAAALVITLPTGVGYQDGAAYVFDGGLQKCGDGDKYQDAVPAGRTLYFYGDCR